MTNEEKKTRLRRALGALRAARCTCDGRHDPYDVGCPRMLAEVERDEALAVVRGLP